MIHRVSKWTGLIRNSMSRGSSVTFTWDPDSGQCESVSVAGSFTSWQPVSMIPPKADQQSRGYWTFQRHLDPGFHEYKFVVDGKWVHDDKTASREDGMGGKNNVIHILEEEAKRKLLDAGGLDEMDDGKSVSSRSTASSSDGDTDEEWEVLEKSASASFGNSQSSSIEFVEADSSGKSLEVERKFIVPSDYVERLEGHGFEPVEPFREVLNDNYYDFAVGDFPLLTNDHWLRQRNGDWELKYPVGRKMSSSMSGKPVTDEGQLGTTFYHETSTLDDIMAKIRRIVPDVEENATLANLVASSFLKRFAQLETKRKCFRRASENINIVVDVTDWGYMIGEIEILVGSKEEVPAASRRIEQLARSLDFSTLDVISVGNLVCCSSSSTNLNRL